MSEGIAIVGMSGRFPGARDVDRFWANIREGVESITHFTPAELDVPPPGANAQDSTTRYVCAKGLLDDVELFDARFFGYLPREAELMDPQHRIFLEMCWEALEHAGHDAQRYPGAIGFYAGCYMDTYLLWNLCSDPRFLARLVDSIQVGSLQTELGNDKDYLATRVAFKLGLRGPAMTLQTACSTSLVAIATACQALDAWQCDMALAGGITLVLPQKKGYFYKEGGMLSPDGHCRTFDENAAGTVFSNGAAVVVLKRLADAVADGDTIHAVIRGYATNNDGGAKVSYTAPSVEGQAEVIALALAMSGIDARTIGYVEAHGTATPIGDPIEIAGLTTAYRAYGDDTGYCAIGSVKTNLGHLDVASGAIGLIKAALSIRDGVLPPTINFTRPNPKIDFTRTPFYVNTQLRAWPASGNPRRAGVSSFGVGGTNAHVIVEQAPDTPAPAPGRAHSLLVLSARSEAALAAQAGRLAAALEAGGHEPLEDVAWTLQAGRREFEHRRCVVVRDRAQAIERLRAPAGAGEARKLLASRPGVVFMFPGQGAQHPGMARELHAAEPVYREVIERCCAAVPADLDLRAYLLWDAAHSKMDAATAASGLAQTMRAQPALFAVEMALARLLGSWGIAPAAVLGHSVGEFAAACLAGVLELEDAARLVAERGRLMQAQPPGKMLAVRAALADVERGLPPELAIAAVNSPSLTVVSGPSASVDAFAEELASRSIPCSALVTSHAFHSSMMEPVGAALAAAVAATARGPASVPFISTALARTATDAELADPGYWTGQLMSPVRFADAVLVAAQDEHHVLLEVGPGQTLTTLARQVLSRQPTRAIVPCMGPVQSPGSSEESLLGAVGRLWTAGVAPDWAALQSGPRRRVPLPTYPFERKRFWVEPAPLALGPDRGEADSAPAKAGAAAAVAPAPAGGFPEVEELIQRQLVLLAEQMRALAEENGGGTPR